MGSILSGFSLTMDLLLSFVKQSFLFWGDSIDLNFSSEPPLHLGGYSSFSNFWRPIARLYCREISNTGCLTEATQTWQTSWNSFAPGSICY